MKLNKKVLFFGRDKDIFSRKVYDFLLKKFNDVNCVWSIKPKQKKIPNIHFKNVDILISFRSYFIFKSEHLENIKDLSINFHPGPPKYRGFGCANYAIYNKDKFYGVTAHLINHKIDNGKILDVKNFKIHKNISLKNILNLTHTKQVIQFKNVINNLIKINFDKKKIKKKFFNNYKWSSKLGTKSDLDKFYEIKNEKDLNLKIRATKIERFKAYKFINNKKIYIS
jgi:methionyl-tRNA formyltransferase